MGAGDRVSDDLLDQCATTLGELIAEQVAEAEALIERADSDADLDALVGEQLRRAIAKVRAERSSRNKEG